MRTTLLRLLPALALAPALLPARFAVQDPEAPLAPGTLAEVNGEPITESEYGRYLMETVGLRPLQSLVARKLAEAEVARLELKIDEEAVQRSFGDVWQQLVERWRGDEEQAKKELRTQGFTYETYKRLVTGNNRHDARLDAICKATREIGADQVRAEFERLYGPGGVRVDVRHVFLDRNRVRGEIDQPTPARVEAEMKRRIEVWLEVLSDGGDFSILARDNSHDGLSKNNGGALTPDQQKAFGERFLDAIPTAAVGLPMGPVISDRGAHLIEVTARETTTFADVRAELTRSLKTAQPTSAERRATEARLLAEGDVKGL